MASTSSRDSKKVSFGEGTAPPKVVRIAVSISRHETVEQTGVTTYFIDVLQCGKVTVVKRRYKDFEILNKTLVMETGHLGYSLPQLPQKRWFQTQRWLNRYDPAYIDDRRYGLEVYLRSLLRLSYFIDNCSSLRSFLNISALVPEDMFALERDAFDAIKNEFTYFYEPEPDDDTIWKPVDMNLSPYSRANSAVASITTPISKLGLDVVSGKPDDPIGAKVNLVSSRVDATSPSSTNPPSAPSSSTSSAQNRTNGSDSDHDSDGCDDSDDDERISAQAVALMGQTASSREFVVGSLGNSKFASVFIDGNLERRNSFRREDAGVATSPSSRSTTLPSGVEHHESLPDSEGCLGSPDGMEFSPKQEDEDGVEIREPSDPNDIWTLTMDPRSPLTPSVTLTASQSPAPPPPSSTSYSLPPQAS